MYRFGCSAAQTCNQALFLVCITYHSWCVEHTASVSEVPLLISNNANSIRINVQKPYFVMIYIERIYLSCFNPLFHIRIINYIISVCLCNWLVSDSALCKQKYCTSLHSYLSACHPYIYIHHRVT